MGRVWGRSIDNLRTGGRNIDGGVGRLLNPLLSFGGGGREGGFEG